MPVLASGVPSYGALCQDVCVAWFESCWVGNPSHCVHAAATDSQAGIVSQMAPDALFCPALQLGRWVAEWEGFRLKNRHVLQRALVWFLDPQN